MSVASTAIPEATRIKGELVGGGVGGMVVVVGEVITGTRSEVKLLRATVDDDSWARMMGAEEPLDGEPGRLADAARVLRARATSAIRSPST